jgi:hypothetical protein
MSPHGRSSQMEEFKFADDSLLEERGFELSVPVKAPLC